MAGKKRRKGKRSSRNDEESELVVHVQVPAAPQPGMGVAHQTLPSLNQSARGTFARNTVASARQRAGLFIDPEKDRIQIAGDHVVRAAAIKDKLLASRSQLETLREELNGLTAFDDKGQRGNNKQAAPISRESLDLLRNTVDFALVVHESPTYPRGLAEILKGVLAFLEDVKRVLDQLSATFDSMAVLALKVTGAITALGVLYQAIAASGG